MNYNRLDQLVQAYIKKFDNENSFEEDAIKTEFQENNANIDPKKIYIKSAALNTAYKAGVLNIHMETVSKIIASESIDSRLEAKDPDVVKDLSKRFSGELNNSYLSFASKFCSFYNTDVYPIYDRAVREAIAYFAPRIKGFKLIKSKLENDYDYFKEKFSELKDKLNLKKYTNKELDKFLWLFGKKRIAAKEKLKEIKKSKKKNELL